MLALSARNQMMCGFVLILLIIITRGHHFDWLHNLPSASWAAFFLAGVYLRSSWPLPGLFALTWILDFTAYYGGSASGSCLTPAYFFLLPAYSSLWLAGRWYASQYQFDWRTLLPLSFSLVIGTMICKIFSSGGFYFFSGRFEEKTFVEFVERLMRYFPLFFESFLFYIGIAIVVHSIFVLGNKLLNPYSATMEQ